MTQVKRRKRKKGGGRKPMQDTVRLMTKGLRGDTARLTLSEDIVEKLANLHDTRFGLTRMSAGPLSAYIDRFAGLRAEFVRMADLAMPAVLMRIEPPTFDPKGNKIWRARDGRRFFCQVNVKKLGIAPAATAKQLETLWIDDALGVLLIFPDGDMDVGALKADLRTRLARSVRV